MNVATGHKSILYISAGLKMFKMAVNMEIIWPKYSDEYRERKKVCSEQVGQVKY